MTSIWKKDHQLTATGFFDKENHIVRAEIPYCDKNDKKVFIISQKKNSKLFITLKAQKIRTLFPIKNKKSVIKITRPRD